VNAGAQYGPLNNPGRLSRLSPFLGFGTAGTLAVLAINSASVTAAGFATLTLAFALFVGIVVLLPWERLPTSWQVAAPLASVLLIAVARDVAGGPPSGLAVLLLLPITWSAVYGPGREVWVVVAVAVVALVIPAALSADYPASEVGRAITLIAVALPMAWALRKGQRGARTDALTGLPNRRAWDDALAREFGRSSRTGSATTLIIVDLDYFKAFNDAHGHPAGDQLLRESATAWLGVLRPYDFLARIGGEEFGVLLPDTPAGAGLAVADRLRRAMPAGQSCSCGLVELALTTGPGDAMRAADSALYAAKESGRARSVVASP
jgi:diguanylate cyclase (GGDEF)-like protein